MSACLPILSQNEGKNYTVTAHPNIEAQTKACKIKRNWREKKESKRERERTKQANSRKVLLALI